MTTFTYYYQDRKPFGIRRFERNLEQGEKWDEIGRKWVKQCCPRFACAGDQIVDVRKAEDLFPGCTTYFETSLPTCP